MPINPYICAVCKNFDMKRKRRLAWVLLTVCMVMLVASVFPHHHHADLTLCLHADMDTCAPGCPDVPHSHPCGTDCGNACVTFFRCSVPQHTPSVRPVVSHLFHLFLMPPARRLQPVEVQTLCRVSCYVERLHPVEGRHVHGLRAPPRV